MDYDLVVVRETMLVEVYGTFLWQKYLNKGNVIATKPITEMDNATVAEIKGKNILLVGGYYRENMSPILASANSVTVYYSESDIDETSHFLTYKVVISSGFASWMAQQLCIKDELIIKIAKYLDEYAYGDPSEDSLCFQTGLYTIDKPKDLDKVASISSIQNVEDVIALGKSKRIANLRVADQRVKSSKELTVTVDNKPYKALVSIGDSPIVDTCLLLAKKSTQGIGILFRYDMSANKTFVSARTTKESGINAGQLMKSLVNGGGSRYMGGGSVSTLLFPEQLLK
jgi:hypothetical protein